MPQTLTERAISTLRSAGITPEQWARFHFEVTGEWHGDRCGCSDDRCIGFHHHDETDCGCLPVEIDEFRKYDGDPAKRWEQA